MALTYLTVQDLIWMNLQVTGKVNSFSFMPLEEATYYQYSLGKADALHSAARFAPGFVKKAPFKEGNLATAFLGLATFLSVNGFRLVVEDSDAANWFRSFVASPSNETLQRAVQAHDSHHGAEVQDAAAEVMERYPATIRELAFGDAESRASA